MIIMIFQLTLVFAQDTDCGYKIIHESNLDISNEKIFLGNGSLVEGFDDGYIFIDVLGDFIIHYDQDGNIIHRFGRSGSGPGDLNHPIDIALDFSDNEIIVADRSPHLSVFSYSDGSHSHDIEHGFSRVTGISNYSSGEILLSGIHRGMDITDSKLIHVYDIENETVESSFHRLSELRDVEAMIYRSHNPVIKSIGQDGDIFVMNIFEPAIYQYSQDLKLERKLSFELDGFMSITDIDESEFTDIQVITRFSTILGLKVIDSNYLIINTWRPEVVSNNLSDDQTNRKNYLVNLKNGTSCNLGISYKLQVTGKPGNKVYFSSSEKEDFFFIYRFNGE